MNSALDHKALAELLTRPRLRRLLEVLNADGEETRIVGGAVRNALLGREVTEVDLASTAAPDVTTRRTEQAGFKAVPTGIEHGTVTIIVDGEPFEVTTLREDVETDGRYAIVCFGNDFKADAFRRDFTINALSIGIDGALYDYTDGEADLAAGRVRFIGDAHARIREDFLRILRFFRFHAEYAKGEPDREGLLAASTERAGLERLSRERVRNEILKLLKARRALETLAVFSEYGFLPLLLGGVAELGRFARVAESGLADPAAGRLAALTVMTEDDAERLRERLRLSNEEQASLATYGRLLARLKTMPDPIDALAMRRLAADHPVAILSLVFTATAGEPSPLVQDEARALLGRYARGEETLPVFPLRGADLIAHKIPPGPKLGELLGLARQAWLERGCPQDEASARALLQLALEAT
ncbi:CCA tRNA nucleotidyltransferase [Microvirga flavescens]|uniref:CCA tRNA nucleotidyltransferase n=1 Tax=Microvirga flavescens TaxID=2249811 RepID=UPI000DD64B82|nr:CCA tRNA nucleotidyltransferase [Microvirga flavescens]